MNWIFLESILKLKVFFYDLLKIIIELKRLHSNKNQLVNPTVITCLVKMRTFTLMVFKFSSESQIFWVHSLSYVSDKGPELSQHFLPQWLPA